MKPLSDEQLDAELKYILDNRCVDIPILRIIRAAKNRIERQDAILKSLTPRPISEVPNGEPFFIMDEHGNPLIRDMSTEPKTFVLVSSIKALFSDNTPDWSNEFITQNSSEGK